MIAETSLIRCDTELSRPDFIPENETNVDKPRQWLKTLHYITLMKVRRLKY